MTDATPRTWEITDLDGGNRHTVTLAQYRAEIDAAKVAAMVALNSALAQGTLQFPAANPEETDGSGAPAQSGR